MNQHTGIRFGSDAERSPEWDGEWDISVTINVGRITRVNGSLQEGIRAQIAKHPSGLKAEGLRAILQVLDELALSAEPAAKEFLSCLDSAKNCTTRCGPCGSCLTATQDKLTQWKYCELICDGRVVRNYCPTCIG